MTHACLQVFRKGEPPYTPEEKVELCLIVASVGDWTGQGNLI